MPTLEERFWAKVDRTEGCWNWTGARINNGYGQIRIGGAKTPRIVAHRLSWEMANGPIPEGMFIDHTCHNRACVKPEHLRPVTHKQNCENREGAARNSKTGVRGVCWDRKNEKYFVSMQHAGQFYFGGRFSELAQAEAAAIALRNRLFTHNDADRAA